jgi:hypothetical protein
MRRYRIPLAAVLALFLLFDVVTAFRVWWYGWPTYISMSGEAANQRIVVDSVPWTGTDLLVLSLWTVIHILLIYAVIKGWRANRIRV